MKGMERGEARGVQVGLLRYALALLLVALAAMGTSQSDPTATLRDLLDRGYYNAAAQLEGPNLVAAFPDDPTARYLYAQATYFTGDYATALEALDVASRLLEAVGRQAPPEYAHLQGLLLAATGDNEGALAKLQEAFGQSGSYQFAMDWGMVAWQDGRLDEALNAYSLAAQTTDGQREPWPHLNRGRIFVRTGQWPDAITALERAIDVVEANDLGDPGLPSPAYVEAFYRLGRVYEALEDWDAAEASYKQARTVDPSYSPAIQALDELTRRLP